MSWVTPILVALIGGPLMLFLKKFDSRNSEQHAQNLDVLERIEGKVDKVDERLNDHVMWHLSSRSRKKESA